MAAHLTLQQRQRARAFRRNAKTVREVAVEIGCSLRTVKRVTHGPGTRESQEIAWSPGAGRLSLADGKEISRGLSAGDTLRLIAGCLGRGRSPIWRDVRANGGHSHYRAVKAHYGAYERARGPKTPKLVAGTLCRLISDLSRIRERLAVTTTRFAGQQLPSRRRRMPAWRIVSWRRRAS